VRFAPYAVAKCTLAGLALLMAGCGGGGEAPTAPPREPPLFGEGPRFAPRPYGAAVRRTRPVDGMRCERRPRGRYLAHLEIFVDGRVVRMPAGIGIAPPHRRDRAHVRGGRCDYPLRTTEPTGLIEIERGTRPTLGDLFAIWGQPLSRTRLLSFRGSVVAFVGARRFAGDPRDIALERHAVVTFEIGRYVRPYANYVFPR
jgi:hypothetical protein